MITEAITKIVAGGSLTYQEAFEAMSEIMEGKTTLTQNASFLVALSTRGVTKNISAELLGLAVAMRSHGTKIESNVDVFEVASIARNNCKIFDVATAVAFVAVAGGLKVSQHGNKAFSRHIGSADTLEALGANILIEAEDCAELLQDVGTCFYFTPKYYSSMKFVSPIQQELRFETVFDILEALTNPIPPKIQLLGVSDDFFINPLAEVLKKLNVKRGMVVSGTDGIHLFSVSGATSVCEFSDNKYENYKVSPGDFGFKLCQKSDLIVGDLTENAEVIRSILSGEDRSSKYDAVLLNAGASFYIADKVSSISDGIELARSLIDNGQAKKTLEKFIKFTNA